MCDLSQSNEDGTNKIQPSVCVDRMAPIGNGTRTIVRLYFCQVIGFGL